MFSHPRNRQRFTTVHAHILREAATNRVDCNRKDRDRRTENRPCWQGRKGCQGNTCHQHRQHDGQNLEPDAFEQAHVKE